MFGRRIFLEPVDNHHDQRRRNEFIRQLSANQRHGIPFTELTSIPLPTSSRNDGLMLDLNFILMDDSDRIRSNNNLYLQTNYGNASNHQLLEYIRQMEERYMAMERELARTKMLIPALMRGFNVVHQSSQTDVNWKEYSLAKYGNVFGSCSRNQYKNNQEQINALRRKHYTSRKNKDSFGKTFADTDWMKYKNSSQNFQNDVYPIKEPDNLYQSKNLSSNSTAVCSMRNVAVILPNDSAQLNDFAKDDPKVIRFNICKLFTRCEDELIEFIMNLLCKTVHSDPIDHQKNSMEACQTFEKKHEPETCYYTDYDVKQEDHKQSKPVNTTKFQPIIGPKLNNDVCKLGSEIEQSTSHQQPKVDGKCRDKLVSKRTKYFENTDARRKDNSQTSQASHNYWNHYGKKLSRCSNDSSRHSTRMPEKQRKEVHKKNPTPRSNVHTAYAPMVQSPNWNPLLDPNGFTIQLLRLAVLLYAPALMPALNSLIARQNAQTPIPIPCSEGSNDLLTQVFTILSNQQCVPNLSYASNSQINESSRSNSEPNTQNRDPPQSENLSTQLENANCSARSLANQCEKNTIAVNTSLEICCCNNMTPSLSQLSKNSLNDQVEQDEQLLYTWTNDKTKSSETIILGKPLILCEDEEEKSSGNQQENPEFSGSLFLQNDNNSWEKGWNKF
ncbi:uncharacterized protein LOC108626991 [Ceratina calcarata]|uniref:Uncharacterized protein LOC108626991 n=1 Tax=Ceratina calcarata TaxID=156304 RepID=A0AAJ7S4B8_9HYME|nr:uncharacterized protein LOC108626991 [Ceratina calcarata]